MDAGIRVMIVAAVAKNGVIGMSGDMPWHLRTDLRRFSTMTKGHTVVMGGETMRGIYTRIGRALPKRRNIVVTRHPEDWRSRYDVTVAGSPEEAMGWVETNEVFICGGAKIYEAFMAVADELRITEVDAYPEGDVFFPEWDKDDWDIISEEHVPMGPDDDFDSTYRVYRRKRFIAIENARVDEQKEAMSRIAERSECPFCMENLRKEHGKPVLMETDHWILTENQWPYATARRHLIAILKDHVERMSDMPEGAGEEMIAIMKWVEETCGMKSGALAMRFGDMSLTGATVSHLHFHVIEPHSPDDEGYEPVRFRIGGKKKEAPQ